MEDEWAAVMNFMGRSDRAFFAIFDGHAGGSASKFAAKHLADTIAHQPNIDSNPKKALIEASLKVDTEFLSKVEQILEEKEELVKAGTTVVSVLIQGKMFYCSNLGDSGAIMSRNGRAVNLSVEHRPTQKKERKRILDAGTSIHRNRLGGTLAVPRGIGDAEFKDVENHCAAASTAEPSIKEFTLDDKVEFLVLACDGLWDVCEHQEVVDFVHSRIRKHQNLLSISKDLVNHALEIGSTDNVSVLIISVDTNHPGH